MLPALIKESLSTWFDFLQKGVHCQVATVSKDHPHIRTMLLYDVTPQGQLVLLSRTDTQKWRDLQRCPNIAMCLVNLEYGQIIVEGTAEIKTKANNLDDIGLYWKNLPKHYQGIYLFKTSDKAELEMPETFGVIFVKPRLWEILQINKENYLSSSRKQFRLIDEAWSMQELPPV